ENTSDLTSLVKGSDKITMIDLYADWCVACKELDKYTFSNTEVASLLNKINLIKFDITKTNKDNSDFLKKYKLFGPPTLLFFTPDGNEIPDYRIIGYVDAKLFIKKFNHINKQLSSKL
ncbi:MAG: thioredoxin fold domain-containing protein, partial [Pelagibacterales bacterium]|nr:thioredoxin fold domain-containing protein [Pelagibacterales bacterium]